MGSVLRPDCCNIPITLIDPGLGCTSLDECNHLFSPSVLLNFGKSMLNVGGGGILRCSHQRWTCKYSPGQF
jgi:hypothetical protein